MHEEQIQKLGLTEGESRVYVALLKLGSSTVGPVAKQSGIASSKIYEVLNRLIEKGLASFIIKEKTKYFQALEPERLKDYLEKKKEELDESQKIVDNLLPGLKSLIKEKNKQEAEIFVGEKGIQTAYDIMLENAKPKSTLRFLYMHDPKYDDKVYELFYGKINYNQKIVAPLLKKKKMDWLGIVNNTHQGGKFKHPVPPKPIIQRYTNLPLPGVIDTTDNAVFISIWADKPLGVLIRSEDVAYAFNKYFDTLWAMSRTKP